MTNRVETSIPGLLSSAGHAAAAAAEIGGSIGLLQNTGAKIREGTDALTLAVDACENAKVELSARRATLRGIVNESRAQMVLARDNFKPVLGPEINPAWEITGLTDSLTIPETPSELKPLLRSFSSYLGIQPDQELESRGITAVRFGELHTALETAFESFSAQELVVDQARLVRSEKAAQLRKRLRDLISELDMLLDPLDVRWKRFGFNMPGAAEKPDFPVGVVATLIGPTAVALKWGPSPRAQYYRVWKKVMGTDAELIAVGNPADLDFTVESLPTGATIELAVSAVNDGGESELSNVVKVVTQ